MDNILERLNAIERKLDELAALNKETLNLKEAARYLDFSCSHLYKLTSGKEDPSLQTQRQASVYFEAERT
jgi:predicted transcriptional regulator